MPTHFTSIIWAHFQTMQTGSKRYLAPITPCYTFVESRLYMKIIILEQAFVLYVKVLYDVIIQTFFLFFKS